MNNENLEKDLECVGSFSVPPPSFRDRALRIAARAGRVMIRIGKVGFVLVVVITAAGAFGIQNEVDDLSRQVDFLLKVATSPDRSWVARELVFKSGTALFPFDAIPTGKFVCGKAGSVPKGCTPDPYVARSTELCVFPVFPGKFEMPRLCPESILHPEK